MSRIIYCITNTINGHIYVGQTIRRLNQRMHQHHYASKKESSSYLYRAMKKYGIDNFNSHILEELSESDDINARECHWIATLNPEYNMTIGGEGAKGLKLTEETKLKIGQSKIGHIPWNKGKPGCYTKDQLATMSNKMKEVYKTKDVWNKGIPNPRSAQIGKDSADKLRAIATGRKRKYLPNGKWTWEYPAKSGS